MRLQAIVFDFDGVIANSEPLHLRAYQDVLQPRGITVEEAEYYERYLGFDDRGVFTALARDCAFPLDDVELDRLIAEKTHRFTALAQSDAVLFPLVADRAREWSAVVPLAIASGALRAEIELILEGTGLRRCFTTIVGADDTARSKPWPDPYRAAIDRLNHELEHGRRNGAGAKDRASLPVRPERAVAIEDSRWGIDSARAAGLKIAAITNTYPAGELENADMIVAGFHELTLDDLDRLCG